MAAQGLAVEATGHLKAERHTPMLVARVVQQRSKALAISRCLVAAFRSGFEPMPAWDPRQWTTSSPGRTPLTLLERHQKSQSPLVMKGPEPAKVLLASSAVTGIAGGAAERGIASGVAGCRPGFQPTRLRPLVGYPDRGPCERDLRLHVRRAIVSNR